VILAPNGYHITLVGLSAPLKQGDKVRAILLMFEKAGKVGVELDVQAIGAPGLTGAPPMNPMKMKREAVLSARRPPAQRRESRAHGRRRPARRRGPR
jgi:hypothetical protein